MGHVMGQSAVRLNPPLLIHDACVGKGGPNDVSADRPCCRILMSELGLFVMLCQRRVVEMEDYGLGDNGALRAGKRALR